MEIQLYFDYTTSDLVSAKKWLESIGRWEKSFETASPYFLISKANDIYFNEDWIATEYRVFLESCCEILNLDKKDIHKMKNTSFWLFGFLEDFDTPEQAAEAYRNGKKLYGAAFPAEPELLCIGGK
jgi:hypothetical protein